MYHMHQYTACNSSNPSMQILDTLSTMGKVAITHLHWRESGGCILPLYKRTICCSFGKPIYKHIENRWHKLPSNWVFMIISEKHSNYSKSSVFSIFWKEKIPLFLNFHLGYPRHVVSVAPRRSRPSAPSAAVRRWPVACGSGPARSGAGAAAASCAVPWGDVSVEGGCGR